MSNARCPPSLHLVIHCPLVVASLDIGSLDIHWSLDIGSLDIQWSLVIVSLDIHWSLDIVSLDIHWSLVIGSLDIHWSLVIGSLVILRDFRLSRTAARTGCLDSSAAASSKSPRPAARSCLS